MNKKALILSLTLAFTLAGCATAPPKQPNDLCKIFEEKPDWYFDANISLRIAGYPLEVLEVKENMIKQVKIQPKKRTRQ